LLGRSPFYLSGKKKKSKRLNFSLLADGTMQIKELQFGPLQFCSVLRSKVCLFCGCFRQGQAILVTGTQGLLRKIYLVAYCYVVEIQFSSKYPTCLCFGDFVLNEMIKAISEGIVDASGITSLYWSKETH